MSTTTKDRTALSLTLEDIGRLAGVSRATVSRVVNGNPRVNPDVRQRVEEVIARTGYAPNLAARSLVSGRTGVIGLVIPSRVHSLFEDPYFGRLIQGVSAATNELGNTLSLFLFQNENEEAALYPRLKASRLVDGLIITATRMADPLLVRAAEGGIPVVMVGRPDVDGMSYVDVDNHGGARLAAIHLSDLGYERIGLLGAPTSTTAGLDRLSGFVEGLALCGKALHPSLRVDGAFTESSGYQAMKELIGQKPEAVFVASDTMAVGALRALREARIRVPQDIAVVSFDGFPASETSVPALTTVRQPVIDTGKQAVRMLHGIVTNDVATPAVEILPVELIVRESCGAARTSADFGIERGGTSRPATDDPSDLRQ